MSAFLHEASTTDIEIFLHRLGLVDLFYRTCLGVFALSISRFVDISLHALAFRAAHIVLSGLRVADAQLHAAAGAELLHHRRVVGWLWSRLWCWLRRRLRLLVAVYNLHWKRLAAERACYFINTRSLRIAHTHLLFTLRACYKYSLIFVVHRWFYPRVVGSIISASKELSSGIGSVSEAAR